MTVSLACKYLAGVSVSLLLLICQFYCSCFIFVGTVQVKEIRLNIRLFPALAEIKSYRGKLRMLN